MKTPTEPCNAVSAVISAATLDLLVSYTSQSIHTIDFSEGAFNIYPLIRRINTQHFDYDSSKLKSVSGDLEPITYCIMALFILLIMGKKNCRQLYIGMQKEFMTINWNKERGRGRQWCNRSWALLVLARWRSHPALIRLPLCYTLSITPQFNIHTAIILLHHPDIYTRNKIAASAIKRWTLSTSIMALGNFGRGEQAGILGHGFNPKTQITACVTYRPTVILPSEWYHYQMAAKCLDTTTKNENFLYHNSLCSIIADCSINFHGTAIIWVQSIWESHSWPVLQMWMIQWLADQGIVYQFRAHCDVTENKAPSFQEAIFVTGFYKKPQRSSHQPLTWAFVLHLSISRCSGGMNLSMLHHVAAFVWYQTPLQKTLGDLDSPIDSSRRASTSGHIYQPNLQQLNRYRVKWDSRSRVWHR